MPRAGLFVAFTIVAAGTAAAQPVAPAGPGAPAAPPAAPSAHVREGFYARAQLGVGSLSVENPSFDERYQGGGLALSLQGGMALTPRLVLFAELFDHAVQDPDYRFADGATTSTDNLAMHYRGVGLGATYYVWRDYHASAMFAAARVRFTSDDPGVTDFESRRGPALVLQLGRDWWVRDTMTMGVALRAFAGSVATETYDLEAGGVSIAVSAAYH